MAFCVKYNLGIKYSSEKCKTSPNTQQHEVPSVPAPSPGELAPAEGVWPAVERGCASTRLQGWCQCPVIPAGASARLSSPQGRGAAAGGRDVVKAEDKDVSVGALVLCCPRQGQTTLCKCLWVRHRFV